MNVNHLAFATSTTLAVATGLSVFAAATTASTVAIVAYTILAATASALSIASLTAWGADSSDCPSKYFENLTKHAGYAITGVFTFVSQNLFAALVKGMSDGIAKSITRRIAGEDQTYKVSK